MKCLDHELLSAYADRQAAPEETLRAQRHLAACEACRASLDVLRRLKSAVSAGPAPAMPEDLRLSLESMAAKAARRIQSETASRAGEPRWKAWLGALHPGSAGWGFALAGAAAGALLLWMGQAGAPENLPLDLLLEAHHQYERAMPLSSPDAIFAGLPPAAAAEEPDDL